MLYRLQQKLGRTKELTCRLVSRAVYSLPRLSNRDPRRKLVAFQQYCRPTDQLPVSHEPSSADWYLRLRPSQSLRRDLPISLDESEAVRFREGIRTYQSGVDFTLPEVFLACVHKARIIGEDHIVLSQNGHIFHESALTNSEVLEASGLLNAVWHREGQFLGRDICLLASPWSGGYYYHWLLDALPRLSLVEPFGQYADLPLLVPTSLKSFHEQSLSMAGVRSERLRRLSGRRGYCDRLFYPSLLGPTGNPSPHAIAWLRSRFMNQPPRTVTTRRRLYVTRRDASKRRILNEDEIIRVLQQRGFEVVCPGELSFAEQIALFRDVSVVVAPHGGGLTNMVFAPADATLIECFGDNYINGCFWALTNLCGQRHACLTSPAQGLDYSIEPKRLEALLNAVGCG